MRLTILIKIKTMAEAKKTKTTTAKPKAAKKTAPKKASAPKAKTTAKKSGSGKVEHQRHGADFKAGFGTQTGDRAESV